MYLSNEAISNLANYLTNQGCLPSTAWDIAHEFVYRTVEIEYIADCAAIHFDHLEWLRGGNPDFSKIVLHQFRDLKEIGLAYANSCIEKAYGTGSVAATLLQTKSNKDWRNQLARYFAQIFGLHYNGHVVQPNSFFPIKDLIGTIKKLIGAGSPKKSPIGSPLPVHYIP